MVINWSIQIHSHLPSVSAPSFNLHRNAPRLLLTAQHSCLFKHAPAWAFVYHPHFCIPPGPDPGHTFPICSDDDVWCLFLSATIAMGAIRFVPQQAARYAGLVQSFFFIGEWSPSAGYSFQPLRFVSRGSLRPGPEARMVLHT